MLFTGICRPLANNDAETAALNGGCMLLEGWGAYTSSVFTVAILACVVFIYLTLLSIVSM